MYPNIAAVSEGYQGYGRYPAGVSRRITGRSVGEVMGASEGMHQPQGIEVVRLRIIDPEDALRTGIHKDQIDLLCNFLIGLLPGDGFKTIANPLEGTSHAIGII